MAGTILDLLEKCTDGIRPWKNNGKVPEPGNLDDGEDDGGHYDDDQYALALDLLVMSVEICGGGAEIAQNVDLCRALFCTSCPALVREQIWGIPIDEIVDSHVCLEARFPACVMSYIIP